MNCSSCGTNVNQGEMFCRVCGAKIVSQSVQQNSMIQINESQQNYAQYQSNMQQQNHAQYQSNIQQQVIDNNVVYNQPVYNNYSNDEALINAYIGKNVDKLKNGGFSVNTFFFGNIYVLYRKMWLLGIIWFLSAYIISTFLQSFSSVLVLAANIIISIKFKGWYLKHVEEKVAQIKLENPNASHEQLLMICTKKGGTTIVPIIILVVLYILIFIFSLFSILSNIENTMDDSYNFSNSYNDEIVNGSGNIGKLSLSIPSNFEKSDYNTGTFKSYSISQDDDFCRLTLTTTTSEYYDSVKSYLEKNVYYSSSNIVSPIESKNINGNDWFFMSVEKSYGKSYYYASLKDNKIYDIEFSITDDSGVCSNAYSTIIDSLKFN